MRAPRTTARVLTALQSLAVSVPGAAAQPAAVHRRCGDGPSTRGVGPEPERSKRALVHHAAGTFPGQTAELGDDTHFSNYGAYRIARMLVQAIRDAALPLARHLLADVPPYDPSRPDPVDRFELPASPLTSAARPAGS